MKELWEDVKGYEGLYQVSNKGNVKSLILDNSRRNVILKSYNHGGYRRLGLYDKNGNCKKFYVHRLVALTFIPNDNYDEINHIDGNKSNNCVNNLEWVSSKENHKHAMNLGLMDSNSKGRKCKLINITNNNVKHFNTMTEASRFLGFNRNYIAFNRRVKGNKFKVKGYIVKVGDVNNV